MTGDEKFEADLRAAMAPVRASASLKREILLLAQDFPRHAGPARAPDHGLAAAGLAAMRRPWYGALLTPVNLAGFAAAASLALGLFAGIGGYLGQSQGGDEVDIAGLAYDPATSLGDL
jgi:hypothetical protein